MNDTDTRPRNECGFFNSDFSIWSSLFSFWTPGVIMILLYLQIFRKLRMRSRKLQSPHAGARLNGRTPAGASANKMAGGEVIENMAHAQSTSTHSRSASCEVHSGAMTPPEHKHSDRMQTSLHLLPTPADVSEFSGSHSATDSDNESIPLRVTANPHARDVINCDDVSEYNGRHQLTTPANVMITVTSESQSGCDLESNEKVSEGHNGVNGDSESPRLEPLHYDLSVQDCSSYTSEMSAICAQTEQLTIQNYSTCAQDSATPHQNGSHLHSKRKSKAKNSVKKYRKNGKQTTGGQTFETNFNRNEVSGEPEGEESDADTGHRAHHVPHLLAALLHTQRHQVSVSQAGAVQLRRVLQRQQLRLRSRGLARLHQQLSQSSDLHNLQRRLQTSV